MFSVSDLAGTQDEELLYSLAAWIVRRSEAAKQNAVEALSQYLTVAYELGGKAAGVEVGATTSIALDGLDTVLDRLAPILDETFGGLSGELTSVIDQGIKDGLPFQDVKTKLAEKIDDGWGKSITFNRVGKTRRVAWVNPDGTMEWRTRTISRKITLPTDTYAETLARTNVKAAWTEGHRQRYRESGRKGWVYLSVADERTRPHHLALHGKVFIFGSDEEQMALEVMKEPNCRCRMKAWFDDPALDTDPGVYEKQRKEWATNTISQYPPDSDWAKFLQKVAKA